LFKDKRDECGCIDSRCFIVSTTSVLWTQAAIRGSSTMKYENIPELSRAEVEEALRNNSEDLSLAVLSAVLFSDDCEWVESVCIRAASHGEPKVKGNAILGFGHLARRSGDFVQPQVATGIIQTALSDSSEYVRGQAESAADDVEAFTAYRIRRPS
jgi:hypothetical protein